MNAKVKRLWIAALRGGKFLQGQNALRQQEQGQPDSYCCLGVLCELFRRATNRGSWIGSTFQVDGAKSMAQLPDPVRDWAGLEDRDPRLGAEAMSAISMNDRGSSFAIIAERIEQYL